MLIITLSAITMEKEWKEVILFNKLNKYWHRMMKNIKTAGIKFGRIQNVYHTKEQHIRTVGYEIKHFMMQIFKSFSIYNLIKD